MKVIAISGTVLTFLVIGGYLFLQSDLGPLSDETLLRIVSSDVLGTRLYEKTCPRSSYAKDVEIRHAADKRAAAYFKFRPVPGKEAQCPPIGVLVDRRTGEAWLTE